MKKRKSDLSDTEIRITLDTLYTAASFAKNRQEMKLLLRDLLTESERYMLGRRLIIVRMLLEGILYDDICKKLGVGRGTVARVHRKLEDQIPGYENVVRRLNNEFSKRIKRGTQSRSIINKLKRKYPLYFLLFPS